MSNKDLLPIIGEQRVEGIGRAALSILAIGLTAGLTLIAAAKRVGELLLEEDDERKQTAK